MTRKHEWTGNGYLCPITDKIAESTFTDHELEGNFNSCIYCNPDNYKPIGQRLREIADRRKKEEAKE